MSLVCCTTPSPAVKRYTTGVALTMSGYILAVLGLNFHGLKTRAFSLPAGFVFLNWQAALALWQYLRNPKQAAWPMAGK